LGYIIEGFRHAFLGVGELTMGGLLYSTLVTFLILLIGVLLFNKTEQNFVDNI
jgi:lipopolysaccharide transport system permease protein